ncbi:putative CorA like Mg2 transporter protein [Trypanosoma vivax]|nr:cation transporter [Trypanosoma vivax]KAH8611178.1 putative CorA like Mg2 transporter protein [Trypanosoma vivax]KAH8611244.1 putative CorA like Mg2 transporter protein [Trypanosoma vivax]KAH8611555.1 putative CorA like Mg2 transporter protein [Trypanosoma vivax]
MQAPGGAAESTPDTPDERAEVESVASFDTCSNTEMVDNIRNLHELFRCSILTEKEFVNATGRLLNPVVTPVLSGRSHASERQLPRSLLRRDRGSRELRGSRHSSSRRSSRFRDASYSSSSSTGTSSGFMVAPRAKVWLPLNNDSDTESGHLGTTVEGDACGEPSESPRNRKSRSSRRAGCSFSNLTNAASAGGGAWRYGTFNSPWPVVICDAKRTELTKVPLRSSDIVHVEFFNCRGARGCTFSSVKLQESELRAPVFLRKGPSALASGLSESTGDSAAPPLDLEGMCPIAAQKQRNAVSRLTAGSASTDSNLEMCLNWYWVDMVGRDASHQQYYAALRGLTKQFNIAESFLLDRERPLVLPQICTSLEASTQFLICLRVANQQIALDDDGLSEITNRWIIVVDLTQKVIITIHRMDSQCIANMRCQWKSLMEGSDISFQEFLVRVLHDAVSTYVGSLEAHADILDKCESKLFVSSQSWLRNEDSNGGRQKNRYLDRKTLLHFANSSSSPFFLKLLDPSSTGAVDKGLMNMFLYHLHRRASVQYRMLGTTKVVLAESFTKLRLCSKEHADEMCLYCIELTDKALEIRDDAKTLLDMHLSLQSFRTNELMAVLTRFSVFFTPCSFLAAVYGMNFKNIPELYLGWGYAYYWVTCLLMCVLIHVYMSRRGLLV